MDFGPDGALYVADWIDGWNTKDRGRVYGSLMPMIRILNGRILAELLKADLTQVRPQRTCCASSKMKTCVFAKRRNSELATRGDDGLKMFNASDTAKSNQLERVHGIVGIRQMATQDLQHAQHC